MAPKKPSASVPRSNKIRFVLVEADLSDGNLSELTQAYSAPAPGSAARASTGIPRKFGWAKSRLQE